MKTAVCSEKRLKKERIREMKIKKKRKINAVSVPVEILFHVIMLIFW